jgi:putative copper export protein/mono/diheme cytochrome c family protein
LDDALFTIRTVHFASAAMLIGLMVFLLFVAEPAVWGVGSCPMAAPLNRRFRLVAWVALSLALITGAAWLVLLGMHIGGPFLTTASALGTIGALLTGTQFGAAWITRFALALSLALLLLRFDSAFGWRTRAESALAALLSAAFIAGLAWAGHGGAEAGTAGLIEAAGDAAHLIAAGGWVGGLVPFVMIMASALKAHDQTSTSIAVIITSRFSNLGIVTVATLLATGILNSWYLVGSVPHLLGTSYGQLLLTKVGLFVAMVALAAVNRLRLMPRLRGAPARAGDTLRALERNGAIEIVLGLVILAIVGVLGTIPPAIHTQPDWPLARRIDLSDFADATETFDLWVAVAASAFGVAAILGGVFVGRLRWPLLALGALALVWFAPRLFQLVTPAYPTSFYTSPTGYAAQSIAVGAEVYARQCASCHGPHGRGDGPAAKDLRPPPPDLTAAQVHGQPDGDLYWWITHGIGAMPPFTVNAGDNTPWNLIDFIHANADARRIVRPGYHAFVAPDFSMQCPDGSAPSLAELHGRVVHLVVAGPTTAGRLRELAAPPPIPGITTIMIATDPTLAKATNFCSTTDPDVATAFSVYRGLPVDRIDDTEFLVDAHGWLRAIWYPGLAPDWSQVQVLTDELNRIAQNPAPGSPSSGVHAHLQ